MRKYVIAALAGLLVLFGAHAAKASTSDFDFTSFTGDYYLSRGSDHVAELRVREKLVAQFPDFDQNHGILRAIPESYQDHSVELAVQKVADAQGKPYNYSTSHENGNLVLKIGDADTYVHGSQTYFIDYTMRGVSLQQNDHEEFYWDINGDQWDQPFGSVEANVHVDPGIATSLKPDKACYVGVSGSHNTDCATTTNTDTNGGVTVNFKSNNGLFARETLTVVMGFNKGTFAAYSPSLQQWLAWAGLALAVIAPPLVATFIMVGRWRKKGRDAKGKGVIVPQYLPPKEVSVLGSNAVIKEGFDNKAVSATILDLAVRHYIKVYETQAEELFKKAKYELELVKAPGDLKTEEQDVVNMLFSGTQVGTRVKLDDLKTKLNIPIIKLGKKVNLLMATDGYFTVAPDKAKTPYYTAGGALLMLGFFLFTAGIAVIPSVGVVLAGLVVMVGAQAMPARTLKGVELRDYLFGLRDYMQLAEAERLKVLQSPHGDLTEKVDVGDNKQLIKLYEKLLPYAMLFGIEKDWAKEMAPLYQSAPDWYAGNGAFNAVWFASSLSSFSASSVATFAPPSSSSSSGFGGGSSGGGGGGGGGGGW